MKYDFRGKSVGFYMRGRRQDLLDEQLAELFLFAALNGIKENQSCLIYDKFKKLDHRPLLDELIERPFVDYLVISNYHILDCRIDEYLRLVSVLKTSGITVIKTDLYETQEAEG